MCEIRSKLTIKTYFTPVSIVDLEQVNASWVVKTSWLLLQINYLAAFFTVTYYYSLFRNLQLYKLDCL